MTTPQSPASALAHQLISDMEAITSLSPPVDRWSMTFWKLAREFERERERTRVLTTYVAHLLDRVEKLEGR